MILTIYVPFITINSDIVLYSFVHISKARLRAVSLFKTVPASLVSSHNWTSKLEEKNLGRTLEQHIYAKRKIFVVSLKNVCIQLAFDDFVGMRQTS